MKNLMRVIVKHSHELNPAVTFTFVWSIVRRFLLHIVCYTCSFFSFVYSSQDMQCVCVGFVHNILKYTYTLLQSSLSSQHESNDFDCEEEEVQKKGSKRQVDRDRRRTLTGINFFKTGRPPSMSMQSSVPNLKTVDSTPVKIVGTQIFLVIGMLYLFLQKYLPYKIFLLLRNDNSIFKPFVRKKSVWELGGKYVTNLLHSCTWLIQNVLINL